MDDIMNLLEGKSDSTRVGSDKKKRKSKVKVKVDPIDEEANNLMRELQASYRPDVPQQQSNYDDIDVYSPAQYEEPPSEVDDLLRELETENEPCDVPSSTQDLNSWMEELANTNYSSTFKTSQGKNNQSLADINSRLNRTSSGLLPGDEDEELQNLLHDLSLDLPESSTVRNDPSNQYTPSTSIKRQDSSSRKDMPPPASIKRQDSSNRTSSYKDNDAKLDYLANASDVPGLNISAKSIISKPNRTSSKNSLTLESNTQNYLTPNYDPTPKNICTVCRKPVPTKDYVHAIGKAYHYFHFTCSSCNTVIGRDTFFDKNGQPQCSVCFTKSSCPTCMHCRLPIKTQVVLALGGSWHIECFVCTSCTSPFYNNSFFEFQQRPYCETCYYDLFTNKCRACGLPIHGQTINALDASWHPEHFNCQVCHSKFVDNKFYDVGGLPYCEDHYQI
eukprot:TRINITY_DN3673_c0_g1_i1.p1 TRINITY_DN3673_c0_g1~~TRINITY_DN3673_c0_g1_i1.p1  ORF type:complete len:446 (-),score=68.59 TRINITY_DN3673_c0_g1_i1:81-1418(-)